MGFQQLFPVTDCIWISFIVLTLVLFVPILCRRLRFPQIAGLIVTGTLLGPGLLDDAAVIGIVLQAIQMDLNKYKKWQVANGKRDA